MLPSIQPVFCLIGRNMNITHIYIYKVSIRIMYVLGIYQLAVSIKDEEECDPLY